MSPRSGPSSGDLTRSVIFDQIRSSPQISRIELSAECGFTEATISTVVRKLLIDGLVIETGHSESTGGKRRILLDINSTARYALGVSLDHETMTFVVANLSGELVGCIDVEGAGDGDPESVIQRMVDTFDTLMDSLSLDRSRVVGIGIAGPGPLDAATGVLYGRRPSPGWSGFPLEERLETLTGLPVVLDNDATCAALGEYWTRREGFPAPISATVYMADGIGCGILIEGRVFHGASSNAGEVGHISLNSDGPLCHCGARGCVEVYASPVAVTASVLDDPDLAAELGVTGEEPGSRDVFDRVADAAMLGHVASRALIAVSADYLARGIVILSNILDLDEVYLSGPGFARVGSIYAEVIKDLLDAGTFMRAIHPVGVTISHIGTEAAALGAAALILQQELIPHSAATARRRPLTRV